MTTFPASTAKTPTVNFKNTIHLQQWLILELAWRRMNARQRTTAQELVGLAIFQYTRKTAWNFLCFNVDCVIPHFQCVSLAHPLYLTLSHSFSFSITASITWQEVQIVCESNFSILKHYKTSKRAATSDDSLESEVLIRLNGDLFPRSAMPNIVNFVARNARKLPAQLIHGT